MTMMIKRIKADPLVERILGAGEEVDEDSALEFLDKRMDIEPEVVVGEVMEIDEKDFENTQVKDIIKNTEKSVQTERSVTTTHEQSNSTEFERG